MAEARTLGERLPVHGRGQVGTPWWGMLSLIASECVLFVYLIFSYAYLGSQRGQAWPPAGDLPTFGLAIPATLALLTSSCTAEWGKRSARRGRMGISSLAYLLTIALGLLFVGLSAKAWADRPFRLGENAYSSIYFLLTGTHLTHVIGGLIALLDLLAWSLTGRVHGGHDQHRTLVTLYWHFIDAVWIFVFATVYISPRVA